MNPILTLSGDIEFLEYWHAGSGEAGIGDIDDTPIRDKDGLPYLPGRTLKGLFHEAFCEFSAWPAASISQDQSSPPAIQDIDSLFGKESNQGHLNAGLLRFHSAQIELETAKYLISQSMQEGLFEVLHATAIEESGVAQAKSLRCFEVATPIKLSFNIDISSSAEVDSQTISSWLYSVSRLIRKAGKFRNNGLGRCQVTFPSHNQV